MAERRVSFNGKIVMGTKSLRSHFGYGLFLKGLTTFFIKFLTKFLHALHSLFMLSLPFVIVYLFSLWTSFKQSTAAAAAALLFCHERKKSLIDFYFITTVKELSLPYRQVLSFFRGYLRVCHIHIYINREWRQFYSVIVDNKQFFIYFHLLRAPQFVETQYKQNH